MGNVCVNRLISIDSGTLFEGLKRLKVDPEANPNRALINYAEAAWIYLSQ